MIGGERVKRVLMVAYYFPPVAASGSMRPLAFCRNLPTFGWRPQVLTTTPDCIYPAHPLDTNLGQRIPETVFVTRIPYRDRLQELLLCREKIKSVLWGSSSRDPIPDRSLANQATSAEKTTVTRNPLKDLLLDWAFAYPDRQCGWYRPALKHWRKISKNGTPDVIFATGGPWTSFLIGAALAQRFDRPLVIDYRDPWTCNPYYSFSSRALTQKSQTLEHRICKSAAHVIANTQELRDRLLMQYPALKDRCSCIPNGFDREVFRPDAVIGKEYVSVIGARYELCHFGTVYGKRSPRMLLQAVYELSRDGHLKSDDIRLRFVGSWDTTDQVCGRYADELEKTGFLRREPPVPHSLCLREMQRASVLLVLQPESPLQVPAKIYEYIATGRPLLLIGGEGATANLVERYSLGVRTSNQVSDIKHLLRELIDGKRSFVAPTGSMVNQFDYHTLTGKLAAVLEGVSA